MSNYKRAGFGPRFLAFLIDYLVIGSIAALLGYALDTIGMMLSFFVPVLYFGFFYQQFSSSPGKKIFGMKVVKSDTWEKPNFLDALIRDAIGKMLSGLLLGAGYWMVLIREDKQALHDLVAKTTVIFKE